MAVRKPRPRIQEFALIRSLHRRFATGSAGLIQGIGDDAAVIAASPTQWWHLTTDLLTQGVHFDLNTTSLKSVGYRAAMANLSDLAAMGAAPRYLLISLAIPAAVSRHDVVQLYTGLMQACRPHGTALIGGDTSASMGGLFVSLTLLGTTPARRALFRNGARIGDGLYVTGTLGDSLAGLHLLSRRQSVRGRPLPLRGFHRVFLERRHLRPDARVEEGRWLNERGLATAAIDISDGLSGDLRHLCTESGVGAELDAARIPISPACRAYAGLAGLEPVNLALSGGEDYELLFTVPPTRQAAVERQAAARGYRITRIGSIRPQRSGMTLKSSEGTVQPLSLTSYEHFQ